MFDYCEDMSTALQLAPPTGILPVTEAVARVHAVLDTVDAGPVGSVTGRDVAASTAPSRGWRR